MAARTASMSSWRVKSPDRSQAAGTSRHSLSREPASPVARESSSNQVARDSKKPGQQRTLVGTVGLGIANEQEKRFLRGLLGHLWIGGHVKRKPVDRGPTTL